MVVRFGTLLWERNVKQYHDINNNWVWKDNSAYDL